MRKWLIEIVYASCLKKQLLTSFWRALRFVRCDYLIQQEIRKLLGISEDDSRMED